MFIHAKCCGGNFIGTVIPRIKEKLCPTLAFNDVIVRDLINKRETACFSVFLGSN
jgi:hypothetical protein